MKSIRTILSFLSIMLIFILAACGGNEEKNSAEKKEESPKTEDTSYTVEHAMGSTTIEKTPEKVVILTNEGTEALLELGVTPVGAVQSWTGDPWYKHIADDMKDVEVVGLESEVNVEAIAALQPDLIIGNKMRQEAIYEQLSAIAPTVFAEDLRGNWKLNFELYAKALNKEDKGKEVIDAYEARIADLKEKLGDKLNQKVSMVRFMAGDVRIYQKDSFSGVILEQLGFARPDSQNVDEFAIKGATKEQMPLMDGDILFYFTYETGDNAASNLEKEWLNDPLFKNLEVAKKGEVHKVDDVIWNTAGGVKAANLMLDDIENTFLK
ncbi:ABC transporter substrate-binding protein [Niallia endozanthoxylica]|uniref:Iron-siderophore ABC transporter substrate-binding protein n=1 Tax=Niallia endozanthoxylica TaxID=2036016 RepID=A0A5J5H8Q7_9BACI|nr:iron-siderophore ABC transporter substrate-binding protein [Niallia endozanthoxylica]KAA9017049.1 iron-siderophore ABC transporter substrate-binding protein [Niallia endozanthoxylica]